MDEYITREMAVKAVKKMRQFHSDVVGVYDAHDMNLLSNLGRRNIVMSQAQEKFFAQVLSEYHQGVYEDGRTGQPDIVIEGLQKELECKLTSRHTSGSISFQSDYQALLQKGELDYLYIIAGRHFQEFAVLHFIGLSVDDFRSVAPGSRGKVSMYKHRGMKKCRVLLGNVINISESHINKIDAMLSALGENNSSQAKKLQKRLDYWMSTPDKYSFELEKI
jgi:hypothetical protein